ncbi:DUF3667 domain-containing protein [Aurantiacibacter poecillastricola]|uniref:DUF3667 domain-containing protein n=1 Tax=Aurantiacibacter poecillastricola TaxID=3064385 RepID=UPI00273E1F92|nr:DUF3667 domain-containing protein [Aurantiacibacter sp. 219JJ12-13]MDP5261001.1 DUF3667 domain-containing protein [Aurantiacibacter sp. 219JJ12-13]
MNDIFSGLGTASEGGLFARAIEPDSGAKKPHPHQPDACLNCGTNLTGAYCHACGQQGHVHRTIGAFMHDLLHGALHFEGKLWRTLPMLAFRPGSLTRRYIEGERARFVSPMALFLFTVFLMFAIFQVVGLTTPTGIGSPDVEATISDVEQRAIVDRDAAQRELESLAPDAEPAEREAAEQQLSEAEEVLAGLDQIQAMDLDTGGGGNTITTGIDWIDNKLMTKWREDPDLMLYKLQANAYKFSWLLIPISIPFVWLTFAWRPRFKGYDHAVFVTYSLSFVTLLFITASILGTLGLHLAYIVLALSVIVPIHIYKQLRGTYALSRFSAFWRLMVLSVFIWVIIGLFLQLLLVLGAF